jgi:FAD/FMN-containing dehydrogenase
VPEEHHGSLVIMGMLCWAGHAADGERAVAPFRELATPLADMVAPMAYPGMYPPDDPDYHPTAVALTSFTDHIGLVEAQLILERLAASDASLRATQLRVLGGAIARVPVDATAYAHRASRIMVNVAAFYEGEADRPAKEGWVAELSGALHQGDGGAYVNFVGDEGEARVRAAYPGATWDRLAEAKARYDPDNLFHRNANVPPARG